MDCNYVVWVGGRVSFWGECVRGVLVEMDIRKGVGVCSVFKEGGDNFSEV